MQTVTRQSRERRGLQILAPEVTGTSQSRAGEGTAGTGWDAGRLGLVPVTPGLLVSHPEPPKTTQKLLFLGLCCPSTQRGP